MIAATVAGDALHMDVALEHGGTKDKHAGVSLILFAHEKSSLKGAVALIGLLGVEYLVVRVNASLDLSIQY